MSASSSNFHTATSSPIFQADLVSQQTECLQKSKAILKELHFKLSFEARKRKAADSPLQSVSRKRILKFIRAPSTRKEVTPSVFKRMQGPPRLYSGSPSNPKKRVSIESVVHM